MVRRSFRIGLRLGLLAGVLVAVLKVVQSRRSSRDEAWGPGDASPDWPPPQPEPVRPEPPAPTVAEAVAPVKKATPPAGTRAPANRPATRKAPGRAAGARKRRATRAGQAWVEASGSVCPPTHPIKAKTTSMLYHLPGMAAYGRTRPERCYAEEAAAEADGFTRARR